MKRIRIGIAGCGAIGSSLAGFIVNELGAAARLSALYDINASKSRLLSGRLHKGGDLSAGTLKELIARSDLIIEAASAAASRGIAHDALARGRSIMIMSAGGVIGHLKELSALAKKNGARVYIPSGAVSGIDALKASRMGGLKKVTLTTRKSPRSFSGVEYLRRRGIDAAAIRKDTLLFCGPARQAVKYFPQNINVAAVLSLAGIGDEKTAVRIIASPGIKMNVHEIEIESAAGRVLTRTENLLHPDNPKTSFLAVLSAMEALRQITEPVRIGT